MGHGADSFESNSASVIPSSLRVDMSMYGHSMQL